MAHLPQIRHAATYTMWRYLAETSSRVQRPFRDSDVVIVCTLIDQIADAYHHAKYQYGSAARFEGCKDSVFAKQSWDSEATRNLYSSVIATYFRWQQPKGRSEYEAKKPYLDRLDAFRSFTANQHTN